MPNMLITGANRGIGLAYARYFADEGWRVYATCREPGAATDLSSLSGDVLVHKLDVTDIGAIKGLAQSLGDVAIDLLINNAGIYGSPNQIFGDMDYAGWADTFRVNSMAPMAVTEAFTPHLGRGEGKKVVCMSSHMGSISGGGTGYVQYRSSKAALNMVARGMASELAAQRIAVFVFHPGWVQTDMGGSTAPLTPDQSVASMARVIARLTLKDSGRFLNHDGSEVPW